MIRRIVSNLPARCVTGALVLGIALGNTAHADSDAELADLRRHIDRLQRELNETVGRRDSARDALRAEERRIDELLAALRALDTRLIQEAGALKKIREREARERGARRAQVAALEAQVRTAFALGRQPHLKVILNQEHPASTARVLAYYRYFNEARLARLGETQALLARLERWEREIHERTRELAALRETQDNERKALEDSRRRRGALLAALSARAVKQTDEIERLRDDEQRLERLVRGLKVVLPETTVPFPRSNEKFANLKGRLPLPLVGRIGARYGEPKGVGELTWRGLFLSAKEGQAVRAVARGRVAFADWLRGFGLLLILDHGDGYMTLYGHNQALHRRAGEWVEAGQTVAAAGNTGDAPAIGVYFEVRHNSVPHDPLQWCAIGSSTQKRARR